MRRGESQRWETEHDRDYFAAGKERRVQDVVWRQSLRAEAGDGQSLSSTALLWDMSSFYDSVNRVRLWRMVIKYGFPLVIARLAFAVYDAPRALTLEGRLSCPLYARDGVTAGCPFATAFTRLYCVEPFDAFVSSQIMQDASDAAFDSYVDDLVVSATGEEDQVLRTIVDAAEDLRERIEFEMGCEIELGKAAVVASNPRLARMIARRIGKYAGTGIAKGGGASAVNLGCDYAPGRKRTAQRRSGRRAGRVAVLRKRARRLLKARTAIGSTRRMKRVFVTGLLPAAVPDAAVNGVSDQEALVLRRVAATACSPRARGRSLALVSLLHNIPTWRAEVEVILQYSRQVWAAAMLGHKKPRNGMLSLTEIAEKWRSVDKNIIFTGRRDGDGDRDADGGDRGAGDDGRRRNFRDGDAGADGPGDDRRRRRDAVDVQRHREQDQGRDGQRQSATAHRAAALWRSDGRRREWNQVKGPVGAAILSLHRLGWEMPTPFTVIDDWGEEIPLTKVTPAMLAVLLRDATTRALERYAGAKAAEEDEQFVGRRICIDHLRSQLASDRKLSREGKGAFVSALCGAIMTYHRAARSGYLVEDVCPKCGQRGDTLRHRVWECQSPDVAAARRSATPAWLRDEVARRPVSQLRWTKGMLPHPGDIWPRPSAVAEPQADYEGDDQPALSELGIPRLTGKLYVDGSCSQHVIPELRRAATAIVARDPERGVSWRIRMAVPSPMPQTSQAAEHVALPMLHAYLGATTAVLDVASDCAGVVRACNGGVARPLSGARLYGGLLKPVLADPSWSRQVRIRKVPAHLDPHNLQGEARDDALGNGAADEEAKRARDMHPSPTPAQVQDLEAELKRMRYVVRAVAATLPLFPPMPRERVVRRPVVKDGAAIRGRGGHEWVFRAGCWRCSICWTLTIKQDISAEMVHRPCKGPKKSLAAEEIAARGHKLAFVEGAMPVLFCCDCGSFSARRAYGLGAPCRGTPTRAGAQAIARIRKGEQPWQTRHDCAERRRPRLGSAAAWCSERGAFAPAHGGRQQGRRGAAARLVDDVPQQPSMGTGAEAGRDGGPSEGDICIFSGALSSEPSRGHGVTSLTDTVPGDLIHCGDVDADCLGQDGPLYQRGIRSVRPSGGGRRGEVLEDLHGGECGMHTAATMDRQALDE